MCDCNCNCRYRSRVHSFYSCSFSASQSHHLSYDPVSHLDGAYKDQHVEDQFSDIAPDHTCRCRVRIDRRRTPGEYREYNAGQHDDRTFQTDSGIAFQEALAHVLRRLTGKGGKLVLAFMMLGFAKNLVLPAPEPPTTRVFRFLLCFLPSRPMATFCVRIIIA